MSGNKQIWQKEWSSSRMLTVPGHGSNEPSDEIVLFRGYLIGASLNPPKKIIDIGCGKGRNAIYLAKEGFSVAGIDYIKSAISHAKEQAKLEGIVDKTKFTVANIAKKWKFPDGFFDIAIDSLTTVGLKQKDREACSNEMLRTLKPGGIALIRVVSTDDEFEKELMKNYPGGEPNSSIWSETGKFQKNFSEEELKNFYKMFDILALQRRNKRAFKNGREFTATNWWLIIKKHE